MSSSHAWTVDEIARELDLVVFELEQVKADADEAALREERRLLRRRLERLRERLQDLAQDMMR